MLQNTMRLLQEKHLHLELEIIWQVLEQLVKIQLDQTDFAMAHIGHITSVQLMRYGMHLLLMAEMVVHVHMVIFMEDLTVGHQKQCLVLLHRSNLTAG